MVWNGFRSARNEISSVPLVMIVVSLEESRSCSRNLGARCLSQRISKPWSESVSQLFSTPFVLSDALMSKGVAVQWLHFLHVSKCTWNWIYRQYVFRSTSSWSSSNTLCWNTSSYPTSNSYGDVVWTLLHAKRFTLGISY